jgi:hypothetical protein
MSVKLVLDKPVIISFGPTVEEAGWGTHQFPYINTDDSGRIGVTFHGAKDQMEAYGTEPWLYTSSDEGLTWTRIPSEKVHNEKTKFGVLQGNGDRIFTETRTPVDIDPSLLPNELPYKAGDIKLYAAEDIPDSLFDKRWRLLRLKKGGLVPEYEYTMPEYPGMNIVRNKDTLIPPFPFGRMRQAPDGSIWQTHYFIGRDPYNLGCSLFYNTYLFRSTDNGHNWSFESWIPYVPDTRQFKNAFFTEGFCEADIAFMNDGSYITLLRTGSSTPSFISRSLDKGKTWSTPVMFDDKGVWPCLLSLKCGVTLASYGRPGFFVRASSDPAGMEWDKPVEIITPNDRTNERNTPINIYNYTSRLGTCSYSDMIALDDHSAIVVYSDFFVSDDQGIKRKAIKAQKITVG